MTNWWRSTFPWWHARHTVLVVALLGVFVATEVDWGRSSFDVNAEDVSSRRTSASVAVERSLADFDSDPQYGVEALDSCFYGQDNWVIRDPYRIKCHLSRDVVVPLSGTRADPVQALAAARAVATRAHCAADESRETLIQYQLQWPIYVPVVCRDVPVVLRVFMVDDPATMEDYSFRQDGSFERLVAAAERDGVAAIDRARAAGVELLLVARADVEYYTLFRDPPHRSVPPSPTRSRVCQELSGGDNDCPGEGG